MIALIIAATAALIVAFILFVRHCRRHEEPNMHNWREG